MPIELNFSEIFSKMVDAAKDSFADKWPDIKELGTSSIKTLAQNIVDIEKMNLNGTISQEQARLKIDIQKSAFKIVLLTEEGLGLLAVENALNAALNIIKEAVNTAIGFVLL